MNIGHIVLQAVSPQGGTHAPPNKALQTDEPLNAKPLDSWKNSKCLHGR